MIFPNQWKNCNYMSQIIEWYTAVSHGYVDLRINNLIYLKVAL